MGRVYLTTGVAESFGGTNVPGPNEHFSLSSPFEGTTTFIQWDPVEVSFNMGNIVNVGGSIAGGTLTGILQVKGEMYMYDNKAGTGMEVLKLNNLQQFFLRGPVILQGTSTPSPAGTADRCWLYLDNSGGKTRLLAQFKSGAGTVIATEP